MFKTYRYVDTKRLWAYRGGEINSKRYNEQGKALPFSENCRYTSRWAAAGEKDPWAPTSTASAVDLRPPDRFFDLLSVKLREATIGEQGELLTSSVEWNQSMGMITRRATQLAQAFKALRKFDLPLVAKTLRMTPQDAARAEKRARALKRRNSGVTEWWLEYWMGWAPLAGDIGHAVDVLQRWDSRVSKAKVSVRVPFRFSDGRTVRFSAYQLTEQFSCEGHLAGYCSVVVTNQNYLLASQLGFTNPALTAWQIVPFSFMVDWFVNVGSVLGSLEPHVGYQLINNGYAYYAKGVLSQHGVVFAREIGDRYESGNWPFSQTIVSEDKCRQPGGIPSPRLKFDLPKLSLSRAATSISLLRETFLRK